MSVPVRHPPFAHPGVPINRRSGQATPTEHAYVATKMSPMGTNIPVAAGAAGGQAERWGIPMPETYETGALRGGEGGVRTLRM